MRFGISPQQRTTLESMLWAFRTKASDLFDPTRPNEYEEFAKGAYGITYVMPSKAVKRLLSVDREVLLLAAAFSDLQARTIQFAIDKIDGSGGRLEHTLAIIVHRDPSGNNKLKNWGREQGLTVLPVYMAGYDMPSGQALARLLLSEFYSHDPFDVTGPVSDDNQFYGRRDEAQDLARQLQTGQVRACLGIRKIGKTSLLHRVIGLMEDLHNCRTVVVDCSRDAVWKMNAGQLLASIARCIANTPAGGRSVSDVQSCADSISVDHAYSELSVAVASSLETLVLMLDEVDYITPGSPTGVHWREEFNPFWRNLRAVYQEAARKKTTFSLLVSGVSSKWFKLESIDGVENAALAFIPEEYLSPLNGAASAAMIRSIGKTSGLEFDDEAAKLIATTCSHIPFWIRRAGSYIHTNTDVDGRPRHIGPDSVGPLLDSFVQSEGFALAEAALTHLFRVYPELREPAVSILRGELDLQPRGLLTVLRKYGILADLGAHSAVSGRLMEAGLRLAVEQLPDVEAAKGPQYDPTLRFDTLDEWAEEIAILGKQRNKLEKRLRSMAVNFLRFDVLQNKQKGSLQDRVLKVVKDPLDKERLAKLSSDEAIEQFTWMQLVSLIEREWSLFQKVFNDKAAFTLHCTVINIRYDAHAKDADKADIGNYRRSLSWLDGCVARS